MESGKKLLAVFKKSKADSGTGADDNFPLSLRRRVWQIMEFFFACNRMRVYHNIYNLCYWLRWVPSVSGVRDVQYPWSLNLCTQGAAQKDLGKQAQSLKAVAKSKEEIHNATQCSLLTAFPAAKNLWLNVNELYKIVSRFWFLLTHVSLTGPSMVYACYQAVYYGFSLCCVTLCWAGE